MGQELWRMTYFFHFSGEMNLPWMLITLEHYREGSENGLGSRKQFLEYSILY